MAIRRRPKTQKTRRRNPDLLEVLEKDYEKVVDQIEAIGARVDQLEGEIESARESIKEAKGEIKYWGEERREKEKEIREAIAEGNKAAAILAKEEAKVKKLMEAFRILEPQYKKLEREKNDLYAQIEALYG